MLQQAGLYMKDIMGFSYNPLTRVASLTKDLSVNYFVVAEKIQKLKNK